MATFFVLVKMRGRFRVGYIGEKVHPGERLMNENLPQNHDEEEGGGFGCLSCATLQSLKIIMRAPLDVRRSQKHLKFLPAAELSGLRELFFVCMRVFPFNHLSHLHSLFTVTTSWKFDFPEKVTSREIYLTSRES